LNYAVSITIKLRLVSRVYPPKLSPRENHCPSLSSTTSAIPLGGLWARPCVVPSGLPCLQVTGGRSPDIPAPFSLALPCCHGGMLRNVSLTGPGPGSQNQAPGPQCASCTVYANERRVMRTDAVIRLGVSESAACGDKAPRLIERRQLRRRVGCGCHRSTSSAKAAHAADGRWGAGSHAAQLARGHSAALK
jgi:hypothetical protein